MSGLLIIPFIAISLYLLLRFLKGKTPVRHPGSAATRNNDVADKSHAHTVQPEYLTRITTRSYIRKTYITGTLTGKFHGTADILKDREYYARERYYDITLYEAEITDASYRVHAAGAPEEGLEEEEFPGTLPDPLPCTIIYETTSAPYLIQLRGIKLYDIDFQKYRALQQEEDDEVFGTVAAKISGYLLETFEEKNEEQIPAPERPAVPQSAPPPLPRDEPQLTKTGIATGKEKRSGNYLEKEYYWSNYNSTYWESSFEPVIPPGGRNQFGGEGGCFSLIGTLLGFLLGLCFLIAIGPYGIGALLAVGLVILIIRFAGPLFKWIFRLAGLLFLIVVLAQIFSRFSIYQPRPVMAENDSTEVTKTEVKSLDTASSPKPDSVIVHHRVWKDYSGNVYSGDIRIRLADVRSSHHFKEGLFLTGADEDAAYNGMLSQLYAADTGKLNGVYPMLDGIYQKSHPNAAQFANIIVSFVQDIPYTLVLEGACDASQYSDAFTQQYLNTPGGDCDAYERFGINSPVEFMATLKGDCDTRTLLLYTLLSHYGYNVAILSSNFYAHSMLAVNVSLPGKSIIIDKQQYVVWETTAARIPAGVMPEGLSDFSKWKVSLLYQQ